MGEFWTSEQVEYLEQNYKSMSHSDIAAHLGRTERGVRAKASRMGFTKNVSKHGSDVLDEIRQAYESKIGERVNLDELANRLGLSRAWVSRKAGEMGLSDSRRPWTDSERSAASERSKAAIERNGHPRGSLGMKHTKETKDVLAKKSKDRWDSMSEEEQRDQITRGLKTKEKRGILHQPRPKTTWKSGWREIGGRRIFARSAWEANIARYYQFLKDRGEIHEWEHEPETFWFDKIKRGCRSYLPDFRITEKPDSEPYYVEVKGWMDARSKTKLKRFAKYYPQHRLELIETKRYKAIAKTAGGLIDGWE